MANITAEELKQILDVNSKAIEIHLEVNSQFEEIIEKLGDIDKELDSHISEENVTLETIKNSLAEYRKDLYEIRQNVKEFKDKTEAQLIEIDKKVFRQTAAFGGSVFIAVITIIIKVFFGVP